MPLNAKIVQFEVAIAHIVRNFLRIPDLSSDFFQLTPVASASLFPPERLPLVLRVALESDGGFTTQTLQTKTQLFFIRNNLYCLFNYFSIQYRELNLISALYFFCILNIEAKQLIASCLHCYLTFPSINTANGLKPYFPCFQGNITTFVSYHPLIIMSGSNKEGPSTSSSAKASTEFLF